MAIEFNDNIHVKINRPTDFRFGPFISIAQANATIPIAQRYHGLIFGVYTTPLSIVTSDIIYYYYWNGLSNTDIKQLGGKPPVDGSYANQAAMIAAQATQTAQYIYYDGTSYWEYLGTTNGNISDYREINNSITNLITGTGASGQVSFWTGTSTQTGDNGLFWDNGIKSLILNESGTKIRFVRSGYRTFEIRQSAGTGLEFFNLTDSLSTLFLSSFARVGISTNNPTNNLDVNGTGRIRNGVTLADTSGNVLIGTTTDSGQRLQVNGVGYISGDLLIGTTNVVSGHKVRLSGGAVNVTNWTTSSGAYDKLSIDFGETRGIGYDPYLNEIFVLGSTTTPVKIDTDASTNTLVVSSSSNVLVGTSTDGGQKLQVAGTTALRASSTASTPTQIPVFTADPASTTRELVTRTLSELADDLGFGVSSGTFTPTLVDNGGGATYSFTTDIATYTKIGSIVYFNLDLSSISTTGTASGLFEMGGFPFRSGFWVIQDQWQATCNRLSGTGLTDTEISNLIPVASGSSIFYFRNKTNGALKTSITFTSGRIKINGYYTANA